MTHPCIYLPNTLHGATCLPPLPLSPSRRAKLPQVRGALPTVCVCVPRQVRGLPHAPLAPVPDAVRAAPQPAAAGASSGGDAGGGHPALVPAGAHPAAGPALRGPLRAEQLPSPQQQRPPCQPHHPGPHGGNSRGGNTGETGAARPSPGVRNLAVAGGGLQGYGSAPGSCSSCFGGLGGSQHPLWRSWGGLSTYRQCCSTRLGEAVGSQHLFWGSRYFSGRGGVSPALRPSPRISRRTRVWPVDTGAPSAVAPTPGSPAGPPMSGEHTWVPWGSVGAGGRWGTGGDGSVLTPRRLVPQPPRGGADAAGRGEPCHGRRHDTERELRLRWRLSRLRPAHRQRR